MTVPDYAVVVQANWEDVEGPDGWEGTYSNLLTDNLQSVSIQRNAFRGSLRAETATIVVNDPGYVLRPLKESSPLWPNVKNHRRVRVLKRLSAGVFKCWFFGYISKIEPDPVAISPPRVTITAESPLAVLARRKIAVPLAVDVYVWRGDDPVGSTGTGILATLMTAIQFLGTPFVWFDDVGHEVIAGNYGDGTLPLLDAIGQMCDATGCVLACEPLYQVAGDDRNFRLRWYRPTGAGVRTVTWSSRDGEMEGTPSPTLDYGDERGQ